MPYVMVPVPEEHVVDVMQYVTRLAVRASRQDWDSESVEEMFLEADEPVRSLLSVVARAVVAEKEVTSAEAMRALELKRRDLSTILGPLGEIAKGANRHPLVEMQRRERAAPGGRTQTVRVFTMDPEVAGMVRAAERKALEIEPHPLDREAG